MNNLSMNSNPSDEKITRLYFEKELWKEGRKWVMGLDEVGRGCLAGPVFAAGVIFPPDVELIDGLRDSKKITEAERHALEVEICEKALFLSVQPVMQDEIDQLNILKASIKAMNLCVEDAQRMKVQPDHLLVDGNRFNSFHLLPYTCLIKGDDRSQSIAAASILAKNTRDRYMKELHQKWPEYGWNTNVGYPSAKHKAAIQEFGITIHHRKSFKMPNTRMREPL